MARMVIIGAGECGVSAAFTLREQGYRGTITLIGDESSLPYERPPLSKRLNETPKLIRSAENYAEAEIDCHFATHVSQICPLRQSVHLADDRSLDYDRLLLATGARARLFPSMNGCATLRSDYDASEIRAAFQPGTKIGIIGGGFIGLELAAAARHASADVTVFEAGSRILGRAVPSEIAAIIHARHEAEGVEIVTNAAVSRADNQNVSLNDGAIQTFDRVIAGVGAVPNIELAADAGLTVANGIVVDAGFRTSDPKIYAAGDCCNFEWRGERIRLESWKAAQDQGAHAARAMLGTEELYTALPWFWSDQYDLTLQVAGLFDPHRIVHRRELSDDTRIVFQCDNNDRLFAAAGIGPGNAALKDVRILEKLIERGAAVDALVLANPSQNLKRLLKAT